ncbi:hypothetical protein NKG95_28945 [Mesorhizobium sp. M1423]|uniref:hypothetical protein n=1 Tax=unclassified Mesorhizobium TaxID=325217 RepID=UPI00333E0DC8
MIRSKRRTSKFWLAVTLALSFIALFSCIWRGLETAAVGITVMIPAVYGAYVGVGHMDYRQSLGQPEQQEPYG